MNLDFINNLVEEKTLPPSTHFSRKETMVKDVKSYKFNLPLETDAQLSELIALTSTKNKTRLIISAIDLLREAAVTIKQGGDVILKSPHGTKTIKLIGL